MADEIGSHPLAVLDELLGVETTETVDDGIGPIAFYGRCSTEDNQDPETSHGWQLGNTQKFVEPLGGVIATEYFDVGQSRSVPWERREAASQLLAALKDPSRTWSAVVVGEGTRCWFGNQFSLIAPKFGAYGVDLWVPELGGKFDERNPSHKMLMSVLGGMSESERQHVQARVRAAMDAQIDEESADVVRRIFRDYLADMGDRAIANGLNRDGIPCPSAKRPDQNRHRLADGWQASTVRAILENPRYTGYAIFGRWTKHETLLNPDDVAAGHVTRFRRSSPDRIVRSRTPAHPEIVSVDDFTRSQLLRRSRSAGGNRGIAKLERTRDSDTRRYLLRGMARCGFCGRKMHGAMIRKHETYYRCLARSLAPGSEALADHPRTVNLREAEVLEPLNTWIGHLFAPENVDRTVSALLGSQAEPGNRTGPKDALKKRLTDATTRLRRLQAAVEAGADPAALVEAINTAQAERAAAQAELDGTPEARTLKNGEVYAMIDSLGDVGAALADGKPGSLSKIYDSLQLRLKYEPHARAVEATISPRVVSVRVRGGTRPPKCVLFPNFREITPITVAVVSRPGPHQIGSDPLR